MISPLGIVHVSDSNLSYPDGSRVGMRKKKPYKKLIKAERLPIGVACAGVWDLNGVQMEMSEWLRARIRRYETDGGTTVRGLADYLGRSLESDLTPDEMRRGSWLHVAGYTPEGDGWEPEMYVVSNVAGLDDCGNYLLPGKLWFRPLVEEYRNPRAPTPDGQPPVTDDPCGLWFNGFPAGRIAWEGARQQLDAFLRAVWNQRCWNFHEPRTLCECATYLSLHLSVITHLFQMSDYRGPIIGGPTQSLLIPPPRRAGRRPPPHRMPLSAP
jgi:hypothetical protein